MPAVTLQAHYDSRQIVLDEPYDLPSNAPLMVTVLASSPGTDSEEAWLRAVSSSDAFAFLADPAEDIYTVADGEAFREALSSHSGTVSLRRPQRFRPGLFSGSWVSCRRPSKFKSKSDCANGSHYDGFSPNN